MDKLKDILIPRDEMTIMSDLLETKKENINIMIASYNRWSTMIKASGIKRETISEIRRNNAVRNIYLDSHFNTNVLNSTELSIIENLLKRIKDDLGEVNDPNIRDTGLWGLHRQLQLWGDNRMITEIMVECLFDWINFVKTAIIKFERVCKRKFGS